MKTRMLLPVLIALMIGCLAMAGAEDALLSGEIPAVSLTAPEGGQTNDELAEGYINRHLYPRTGRGMLRAPRPTGASLDGAEANLYALLMADIAEVAAGQRASTVFEYAPADVYPKTVFTASDFGVPSILNSDRSWRQEVLDGLYAYCIYDSGAVYDALLADTPYEMYWFDKTASSGFGFPGFSTDGTNVFLTDTVSVSLPVSVDYGIDTYTVDTSYGQGVSAAVDRAAQIVAAHEGESDYARLLAYKEAICDLTSYNHDAANNDDTPYGNPWQLIWVFDGNPSTTVVCEGYSKAFKYLNDLSAGKAAVICVSGSMAVSGSGGPHMWNIVTMEDGYNYFVDVTNCDSNSTNALFMVGYHSGSVSGGYLIKGPHGSLWSYRYDDNPYSEAQLTLAGWRYLDKPAAPAFTLSSGTGFTGYDLVLRLSGDAAGASSVIVTETGEVFPCAGGMARIPMTDVGTVTLTVSALMDGIPSFCAAPVTVNVLDVSGGTLTLPDNTLTIEAGAFQGAAASAVTIPAGVTVIGEGAFADMDNLRLIRYLGDAPSILSTAAAGNPQAVFCLTDADAGFDAGVAFVLPGES